MPPQKPVKKVKVPDAVLFACNMNAVRSPMASAILRYFVGKDSYVRSAGIRRGESDQFAISVMDEIGIDMTGHEPVTIRDLYDTSFDLVITLTPEAHHHAIELTRHQSVEVHYWPLIDPSFTEGNRGQRLEAYRTCRDTLFKMITNYFILPDKVRTGEVWP